MRQLKTLCLKLSPLLAICFLAGIASTLLPSDTEQPTPPPTVEVKILPSQDISGVVTCWGDGLTYGYPIEGTLQTYPIQLQSLLNNLYGRGSFLVINRGVMDIRADQILANLQAPGALAEDPDFVLIMVGRADLAQEVDPDLSNLMEVVQSTASEVQSIIDLVKAHTNANGSHPQVIVSSQPPVLDPSLTPLISLYNQHLEATLTGIDLWFTDNWTDLLDPNTNLAHPEKMADSTYPNALGYTLIAENWLKAMRSLLPPP